MPSAGDDVLASDVTYPATAEAVDSTVADGTTTSTSFTNSLTTTGVRGVAFTAGASGKVLIIATAFVRNGTAGQAVQIDIDVRQGATPGSGTSVRSPNDPSAGGGQSDSAGQNLGGFAFALVTGLTPNSTYNASLAYKVPGGTGTINRRHIVVQYVP